MKFSKSSILGIACLIAIGLIGNAFAQTTTDAFGSGSNQFTLDFQTIGNAGNSNDTTGYGGVPYTYRIGKYAISQNQINTARVNGLIGVTSRPWSGDQPAAYVNWYQAAAFVNWLNISQGYAPAYNLTYSNGSYTMSLWPMNQAWTLGGTNLYRNANCYYFLPSENEWYKAAYYDPTLNSEVGAYWLYPEGINTAPIAVPDGTNPSTAVFLQPHNQGTASVYKAGGLSAYGTMGQGGNVFGWLESSSDGLNAIPNAERVIRGGQWNNDADISSRRYPEQPTTTYDSIGIRVASIDDSWLTSGLVAYYPFNGSFDDYSCTGNSLTNVTASLGTDRFGNPNSALSVTSTSGAISSSNIGITGNHARTISIWMLDTTPTNTAGVMISWGQNIMWKMQTLQYSPFWNANSTYSLGTDGCFANSSILTSPSILPISWHCIVWTFGDSSNSDFSFYVDGIKQTNNPFSYELSSMNTANSQLHVNNNNIGGGLGINGSLDDIRIYNRALSSNEVSALYNFESQTNIAPIGPQNQTITPIAPIPDQVTGVPFTLSPSATSGLPVNLSIKSGPATVSGNTITPTGVGLVVVTAVQPGNSRYYAAPEVTANFTVKDFNQSIANFKTIPTKRFPCRPFVVDIPKATSRLHVTLSVLSGPAIVRGDRVFVSEPGVVVLAANQEGNARYNPATQVTTSFSALPASRNQTIKPFHRITTKTHGKSFKIALPTASSGLPVAVTVQSGNATINGNTVTLTGTGYVTLAADQGGNQYFNPAQEVTTTFFVQ